MILIDTSVWIDHLRLAEPVMNALLDADNVLCHPFVLGELAMGQFLRREPILSVLELLPAARVADEAEVRLLIERQRLYGRRIGYVDTHLLASCLLTPGTRLWTRDRRLALAANDLSIAANLDH